MSTKTYLFLLSLIAGCHLLQAQTIEPLTLDDVTPGGRTYWSHQPSTPTICGIIGVGVVTYDKERLKLVDKSGRETDLLTLQEWSQIDNAPVKALPWMMVYGKGEYLSRTSERGIDFIDLKSRSVAKHFAYDTKRWQHLHVAPGASYIVLSDGETMALLESGAAEPRELVSDSSHDIVYGMPAARNEFGIESGIFFSPRGRYFAFYRIDQSEVTDYPIVRIHRPIAESDPLKYPMAGQGSQHTTVGIYDTTDGSIHYLATGEPTDRYFTNLSWAPDEKSLYIDEVKRSQDECNLVEYSVESGLPLRTVLTERNERYIEPLQPIAFTSDGKSFVRSTRIDGYRHLYLYRTKDGKLIRQLTKGEWEVKSLYGISPDDRYAYFLGNEGYPMGQALYRVALASGKMTAITPERGWHSCSLSADFTTAYDLFSSKDTPGEVRIIDLGKKAVRSHLLKKCEVPSDIARRPEVRLGTIKSADGVTDLYYKMTLPATLEEGKKYPTIVYVYGGPHAQLVTDSWRSLRYNWDNYMAEQGYIVFTVDGRGSDNRGMAFESIIHRQLGKAEMADQMEGVKFLSSLPYVDTDRLGVYGWSFGGFMTTNLMLTHGDTFKVGVAGGPVIDWAFYEIMYGERYMDTPQENPDGYAASRLSDRAKDLRGRLLLIHGGVDPVVVWQNSQTFLNACIATRTYPDYMVYPNHEHNVLGPDRVHLNTVISRYFDDFLK